LAFAANEATASATSITISKTKVTYGDDNAARIAATVGSPAGGTPAGSVSVTSGSGTLCTITLTGGTGTCTLPPGRLPGGSHHLTAGYSGDATYVASQSPVATITVARAPSRTTLALSSGGHLGYRHEHRERLTVTVRLPSGLRPAGTAVVTAGHARLCVITLRGGHGSCVLKNQQLRSGTYRIRAAYRGSIDARPSRSASKTLTIAP
jgi:Bacterial Ig-like domain (group 3)